MRWEELGVEWDTIVIRLVWLLLKGLEDGLSIIGKGREILSTGLMSSVEGTLCTWSWGHGMDSWSLTYSRGIYKLEENIVGKENKCSWNMTFLEMYIFQVLLKHL